MGKYSVPEEIRRLKPKGTSVKPIKGNYYVYTHSQVKDPETGKWKTATGKLIGRIILLTTTNFNQKKYQLF